MRCGGKRQSMLCEAIRHAFAERGSHARDFTRRQLFSAELKKEVSGTHFALSSAASNCASAASAKSGSAWGKPSAPLAAT